MENMKYYIDKAEENIMHTYNRYQIVWDKGDGVYMYDIEGNKYLDFVAGIAVFALGYNNKSYNDALKAQIDKVIHTSNYYYSVPLAEAGEKLVKASGMDRIFFTNSGTEAVEGAIKVARRAYYNKYGKNDSEIIAMQHSFHGRSTGSLAVTGTDKYREPFGPLMGGVVFAEFNNYEDIASKVNEKTCAIIMETLQGEGGIYPADAEFLKKIRKLCDEKGIMLILDEIQCGMGRTGSMYCCQAYGIKPDVMTTAKALGCGIPVGAFLTTEEAATLVPGDHGSTYGGNPLAMAAVSKVFDLYEELDVLNNVKEVGAYLYEKLEELAAKHDCIIAHRGMGLMQGLEFDKPVADIIKKAMDNKLLLINAGANIIRFIPPLVIGKEHVDEMINILEGCIE